MTKKTKKTSTPKSTPIGNDSDSTLSYKLPPALTVETADDLGAELKQLPLAEKVSLTLDASEVETLTTPGLQLIVSLEKTVTGQGGRFQIQGARDPITQAFTQTGLQNLLAQSM